MEREKTIIKYNQTIQISNGMSFLARKCWNILLSYCMRSIRNHKSKYQNSIYNYIVEENMKVDEVKEIDQIKNIFVKEMDVLDLMRDLGIKTHNQDYLKKVLLGLMKTTVEFNILDNKDIKSWSACTLLSSCEIKQGKIKYEFSNLLMDKLLLSNQYARIKLSIQKKMTNKYSLALYENCLKWHDKSKVISFSPKISIKDLRKLLIGDSEKYPSYKEFNRYILKKSKEQVNKVSDLEISIKEYKALREVTHIQFFIKKKMDLEKEFKIPVKGLDVLKNTVEQLGIVKKAQNEPLENNFQ